jgi:hypothetical protein
LSNCARHGGRRRRRWRERIPAWCSRRSRWWWWTTCSVRHADGTREAGAWRDHEGGRLWRCRAERWNQRVRRWRA